MQEVKLELGGIVISFTTESQFLPLKLRPYYHPFFSNTKPDVTFRIAHKTSGQVELGELLFEYGELCAIHRLNDLPVIRIGAPGSDSQQIVYFDADFQGGKIDCIGDGWNATEPSSLERPLLEQLVINLLPRRRGALLHASAVNDQDRGFIFSGFSDAGKSTMARLWEAQAGVTGLSDERIIMREHKGRFWAYGTPWLSDARISSPASVPLKRIFIIHHARKNEAVPLEPAEAVAKIVSRSFPPYWDSAGMALTLEFLDRLVKAVPCYSLGFVPDENIIDFVRCVS